MADPLDADFAKVLLNTTDALELAQKYYEMCAQRFVQQIEEYLHLLQMFTFSHQGQRRREGDIQKDFGSSSTFTTA